MFLSIIYFFFILITTYGILLFIVYLLNLLIILLVRIALCALCLGYYTQREKEGYVKKKKEKNRGWDLNQYIPYIPWNGFKKIYLYNAHREKTNMWIYYDYKMWIKPHPPLTMPIMNI